MSNSAQSLTPDYFESIYQQNADPWNFETSEYEAGKYAATLAALPQSHYQNAFEIGCSIGVLTEQLAAKCDRLLSVDVAEQALKRARERCRELPQVRFELLRVPEQFPDEIFDLIVVSEVGYYLTAEDWLGATDKIIEHLQPGGNAVLVHWTPFVHDYPQTGDAVHDSFKANTVGILEHSREQRAEQYRLDVFERIRAEG